MVKQLLILLFAFVLALPLATTTVAQEAPAKTKPAKEARWDGTVIRSSPDKSTLTVRKRGRTAEMTVQYDSSTRWVSQEHGSKIPCHFNLQAPLPRAALIGIRDPLGKLE
jgi:hypothetical protein